MGRVKLNLVVLAVAALVATGCGATGGGGGGTRLSLVAYSTPREAYAALTPDMTKLADAGLVAKDWNSDQYKGMVTDSVVAIAVRRGNPKNIHTWADLVKPGVEVITPNPFSSGGARWNVMGAYGAQIEQGRSQAEARAYLLQLFKNVPVQDKARAFVDFLRSPQGQGIFADKGYRPVNEQAAGADKFPRPKGLFTIDDLGGWDQVTRTFFDRSGGVMADIEKQVGVSVGS